MVHLDIEMLLTYKIQGKCICKSLSLLRSATFSVYICT